MTITDWLIPDWPAPATVSAVFTTRSGGCSNPPWDSLNLGDHVDDVPATVAANRAAVQKAIASRPIFLQQVHGTAVEHLSMATANGSVADACISTERGMTCTVMVADCLPVLLTNLSGTAVAAAHAGWRGLAGVEPNGRFGEKSKTIGVLETIFSAFEALNKSPYQPILVLKDTEIIAWLGPCIGPTAFEVGEEVKAVFEEGQPGAAQFFKPTAEGKYLTDLAGLARARLQALGVSKIYGNDSSSDWCTVGNPSRFFSHRRDAGTVASGGNGLGTTGRMAACIWIK